MAKPVILPLTLVEQSSHASGSDWGHFLRKTTILFVKPMSLLALTTKREEAVPVTVGISPVDEHSAGLDSTPLPARDA